MDFVKEMVTMKFGSKHVFNSLFLLTGGVTLWVGALFVSKSVMYARFSHHTTGKVIDWGVISLNEEQHRLRVDYNFTLKGQLYTAQHVFVKPTYKNREAAEYALEEKKTDEVSVWYMSRGAGKAPISIVDRKFPYNEMIRLLIVFSIHAYFYLLRRYLYNFRESVGVDVTTSKGSKV